MWMPHFRGRFTVWHQLKLEDMEVARCTVERLMRQLGLRGVVRGQRTFTTISDPRQNRVLDLVKRNFTATRPNQLWVADFTYVATWPGCIHCVRHRRPQHRRVAGIEVDENRAGTGRTGASTVGTQALIRADSS